jgi:hypothetical protein
VSFMSRRARPLLSLLLPATLTFSQTALSQASVSSASTAEIPTDFLACEVATSAEMPTMKARERSRGGSFISSFRSSADGFRAGSADLLARGFFDIDLMDESIVACSL